MELEEKLLMLPKTSVIEKNKTEPTESGEDLCRAVNSKFNNSKTESVEGITWCSST